jgi:hypothetical protein
MGIKIRWMRMMNKMKNLFLFLCIFAFSAGCSKTMTADMISNSLGSSLVSTLNCANPAVVKADVKARVDKWFGLQQKAIGGIGGAILQSLCTTAIGEIVPTLIGATIPQTWGCSLSNVDGLATKLSKLACGGI